jgi:hypothetical protein
MHKLSTLCAQLAGKSVGKYMCVLVQKTTMCKTIDLYAFYTKVYTNLFHGYLYKTISVISPLSHTIHTPYINSNILNRLLINTKHSGELI